MPRQSDNSTVVFSRKSDDCLDRFPDFQEQHVHAQSNVLRDCRKLVEKRCEWVSMISFPFNESLQFCFSSFAGHCVHSTTAASHTVHVCKGHRFTSRSVDSFLLPFSNSALCTGQHGDLRDEKNVPILVPQSSISMCIAGND